MFLDDSLGLPKMYLVSMPANEVGFHIFITPHIACARPKSGLVAIGLFLCNFQCYIYENLCVSPVI